MNLYRWIAVLALTGIACPAFAQYCSPSDPNYNYCTQQEQWKKDEEERKKKAKEEEYERQRQRDEEYAEEQRRSAPQRAEQARQQAENDAAIKALRAKLLASPPLPPDRNPLLGRWRVATGAKPRGGDDLSQLMGMLSNPGGAMCEVVFGGGIIEFKPGSWASNDSAGDDSLGPIQYRMQDKQVFALPDQGLPLLGFDIVDKSTIQEVRLPDCALVRVGAQPAAAPATRAAEPAADAGLRSRQRARRVTPSTRIPRWGAGCASMVRRISSLRCSNCSSLQSRIRTTRGSTSISRTRTAGSAWMPNRTRLRNARGDWTPTPSRSCADPIADNVTPSTRVAQ